MTRIWTLLAATILLAGCAGSGHRAAVTERGASATQYGAKTLFLAKKRPTDKDGRPRVYTVKKGETLFGIAFDYGLDYHELAELNNIQDPNRIQAGQQIRLFPGVAGYAPVVATQHPLIKEQPKVSKYAYSPAAVAKVQGRTPSANAARTDKVESKIVVAAKPETKAANSANEGGDDALEWSMPTQGKLVGKFSETDNRKGIEIAGQLGQPILASAPGKVVYSGSGLRGYGKLLIIKHNNTYLSAYAHNDQLLVKEGQTVTRGQKIAEMGNTDSDQVALHFEVRRFGKPVDPADYLSLGDS
ncbi:MAG: peptidase M23 [Gallionellales bacterium CG_4_9_14_0_8_um_filter_55_61]|nr:MAG: peptidase M23 [Gallionellales bacterium CG_4_9_14_0_8_um_filter_55_61]